ncbi:hypothetical protein [Bradyrhizobium sp. UFLA05-112]
MTSELARIFGFAPPDVCRAQFVAASAASDMALRRMERGGVTLTGTNQLVAELVGNWTTPEGSQVVQVVMQTSQA